MAGRYDEFMSFAAESSKLGEFAETMEKLMTFDNPFEELDENGDGQEWAKPWHAGIG